MVIARTERSSAVRSQARGTSLLAARGVRLVASLAAARRAWRCRLHTGPSGRGWHHRSRPVCPTVPEHHQRPRPSRSTSSPASRCSQKNNRYSPDLSMGTQPRMHLLRRRLPRLGASRAWERPLPPRAHHRLRIIHVAPFSRGGLMGTVRGRRHGGRRLAASRPGGDVALGACEGLGARASSCRAATPARSRASGPRRRGATSWSSRRSAGTWHGSRSAASPTRGHQRPCDVIVVRGGTDAERPTS